jgi:hypothetical protein
MGSSWDSVAGRWAARFLPQVFRLVLTSSQTRHDALIKPQGLTESYYFVRGRCGPWRPCPQRAGAGRILLPVGNGQDDGVHYANETEQLLSHKKISISSYF